MCIGVVGFIKMWVFEEDSERMWWVDESQENLDARLCGFGGVSTRIEHAMCIGGVGFLVMSVFEEDS